MTVVASGLGATCVAKAQGTWGGTFMTTGQRTIIFKTAKFNFDPHYVQGGTYLAGGQLAPLGSARVQTWLDAKVTITGDMQNTAQVPLLIAALGTSSALAQIGTTTAWGINGAGPAVASAPDLNSTYVDMQFTVPDDSGTAHPFSFHSGVVQKAEWVFDRAGLVTYSYDLIFQQVETSTSALSVTEPFTQVPLDMANASGVTGSALTANTSGIAVGTYNSEVVVSGIKKATYTLDRKLAAEADRMYMGYAFQQNPVTNDYVDLGVSLELDYTASSKTALWDILLSGALTSVISQSASSTQIGTSTHYPLFSLQTPSFGVDNPDGTPSPDGPKLVGNTLSGKAHIDASNDAWLNACLVTADTTA